MTHDLYTHRPSLTVNLIIGEPIPFGIHPSPTICHAIYNESPAINHEDIVRALIRTDALH